MKILWEGSRDTLLNPNSQGSWHLGLLLYFRPLLLYDGSTAYSM